MYPEELMSNIYWGFYGGKYDSREKFIQSVSEYNKGFNNEWFPDETVLACTNVSVQYSYWDKEEEEMEEDFELVADNKSGFTAGELLLKYITRLLIDWKMKTTIFLKVLPYGKVKIITIPMCRFIF